MILRSVFAIENGEVITRVMPEVSIPVEFAKLADKQQLNSELAVFVRPFLLEQAPLIRIGLWSVSEDCSYLALDIHHSIADGMSATLLLTMLLDCYQDKSPAPQPGNTTTISDITCSNWPDVNLTIWLLAAGTDKHARTFAALAGSRPAIAV